jgi:DNA-binding GntR family transcriptional regulator
VEIDHESARPVYLQLADILRAMISSGEIPPDRPLPSVKQLQQSYGVAQGTAERAVRILRDERLVHTVIGKGVYVVGR